MKIVLATTLPSLEENERIMHEGIELGHEMTLLDLSDFTFKVVDGKVEAGGLLNATADVVIVRGIFLATKPIAVTTAKLRERGVRVFDNNFSEHRYSIDKVMDLLKLSLAGIPIPDTSYVRSYENMKKFAPEIGFPIVVKSTRAGKGAHIYKADDEAGLDGIIEELMERGKDAKSYLMQEFIPYQFDLRILIIGDDVFAMRRIPKEGEFRANFSLGGSVELYELDEAGRELAKKALAAVGMSVGGVDMLITEDDKRYILEVNHTAGLIGMEQATGKNIARIYLEHAIRSAT